MNDDFFTPEQREIRRLKLAIEAFKKYDEKRKQYINRLQGELEEYSEMYLEMKKIVEKQCPADGQRFAKYLEKIKAQRQVLVQQSSLLAKISMAERIAAEKMVDEDRLRKTNLRLKLENSQLKQENKQLKEKNKHLTNMERNSRKTISDLVQQMESLKRKMSQLNAIPLYDVEEKKWLDTAFKK